MLRLLPQPRAAGQGGVTPSRCAGRWEARLLQNPLGAVVQSDHFYAGPRRVDPLGPGCQLPSGVFRSMCVGGGGDHEDAAKPGALSQAQQEA